MPSGEFSGMDPSPISMQGTEKGQKVLVAWGGRPDHRGLSACSCRMRYNTVNPLHSKAPASPWGPSSALSLTTPPHCLSLAPHLSWFEGVPSMRGIPLLPFNLDCLDSHPLNSLKLMALLGHGL